MRKNEIFQGVKSTQNHLIGGFAKTNDLEIYR
jgi:hypothetical protein